MRSQFGERAEVGVLVQDRHISTEASALSRSDFLRVPPFPGASVRELGRGQAADCPPDRILSSLRKERVGGTYWGARPDLPAGRVIVRSALGLHQARAANPGASILFWSNSDNGESGADLAVSGEVDPWHLLEDAQALYCEADDPASTIAVILGIPVFVVAPRGQVEANRVAAAQCVEALFPSGTGFVCPFTGQSLSVVEAIELCGFWRRLVDSNRGIAAAYGFAFWKKDAVAPLLWSGSQPLKFVSGTANAVPSGAVAVWRARTDPSLLSALEAAGTQLVDVEDGFLRSKGLGADCVPPLSIVVDRLGPHFDPAQPSELELLLQNGTFDADLVDRAARLREEIIKAGLGKYEAGGRPVRRFDDSRPHILVPGQVEDDQSVLRGGGGLQSNVEVLRRVRANRPDAYVIYKPHPDVLAGHRRGAADQQAALAFADRIVTDVPIAPLIDMVDEVHVNTSLTGFEALLRGKPVTTYGAPFYAGWGLTTDLGRVPERRTARRTVDELVAATLLLYPRYVDPVTGLPCPAEVAVDRLTGTDDDKRDMLVGLRRIQGRVMKRFRSLRR